MLARMPPVAYGFVKKESMRFDSRPLVLAVVLAWLSPCGAASTQSRNEKTADAIVAGATATIESLGHNAHYTALNQALVRAQAVLIFPRFVSAGFVVAGSHGNGVLLVRDGATGHWVGPAFYSLTQASVGLQAGAATSEYIVVVHSRHALDTLFKSGLRLGMDTAIAVGPIGSGGGAAMTTDIDVFSRAKGAFLGIALDGAALRVRAPLSTAYYGRPATPADILVSRSISSADSAALRSAVEIAATAEDSSTPPGRIGSTPPLEPLP